jgi:aquaporin Z
MLEALLAEFVGTFALLLAILATGNVFAIGLVFTAVIYLIGGVSGAHINPAVSVAMYLNKSIDAKQVAAYTLSQVAGAIAAYYTFKMTKK